MKTHIRFLFLSIMAAVLTGIVPGCKKSKKEPAPSSNDTTSKPTVAGTYKMYETGRISFNNTYDAGTIIDAQVNGNPISLAAASDSFLVFVALPPAYKVGDNTLTFSDGSGTQSLNIKIEAASTIDEPNTEFQSFTSYYDGQLNEFNRLLANDTTGALSSPEVQEAFGALQTEINNFKTAWQSFSAEEKEMAAHYIKANQATFASLNSKLMQMNDEITPGGGAMARKTAFELLGTCSKKGIVDPFQCYSYNFQDAITAFTYTSSATLIAARLNLHWVAITTSVLTGVSAAWILAAGRELYLIRFKPTAINVDSWEQFTSEQRRTATPIEFNKGQSKVVPVKITLRNLAQRDESSSSPWLAALMTKIAEYNGFMDKMNFLKRFKLTLAYESKAKYYVDKMSYLSVRVTSNSNVTFEGLGGTPSAPSFTFNTNASGEQNFTFEVTYNDYVNPTVTIPVQGILKESGGDFCSYTNFYAAVYGREGASTYSPINNPSLFAVDDIFRYKLIDNNTKIECRNKDGKVAKTINIQGSIESYIGEIYVNNGNIWVSGMSVSSSSDDSKKYKIYHINAADGSIMHTASLRVPLYDGVGNVFMFFVNGMAYVAFSSWTTSQSGIGKTTVSEVDMNTGTMGATVYSYTSTQSDVNTYGSALGRVNSAEGLNGKIYLSLGRCPDVPGGGILEIDLATGAKTIVNATYDAGGDLKTICGKLFFFRSSSYIQIK